MKLTKQRLVKLIIEAMDDGDYEEPYDSYDYEGATPSSRRQPKDYIGEHEGYKFEPNPKRFGGGDEDYAYALEDNINMYLTKIMKGMRTQRKDGLGEEYTYPEGHFEKLNSMRLGIMEEYGLDASEFGKEVSSTAQTLYRY